MIEKRDKIPEVKYISDEFRLILSQNNYSSCLGYLELEVKYKNTLKEEVWIPESYNKIALSQNLLEAIWNKLL